MKVTAERLRAVLHYTPETGVFTRLLVRADGRHKVGEVAGCRSNGYVVIRVDDVLYLAHRLAFLWMTGEWPHELVDHINGRRDDNRWENLRPASRALNNQNRHNFARERRGGLPGAFIHKAGGYRSQILVNGEVHNLGYFKTAEEASAAYIAAKRQLHPGWAR